MPLTAAFWSSLRDDNLRLASFFVQKYQLFFPFSERVYRIILLKYSYNISLYTFTQLKKETACHIKSFCQKRAFEILITDLNRKERRKQLSDGFYSYCNVLKIFLSCNGFLCLIYKFMVMLILPQRSPAVQRSFLVTGRPITFSTVGLRWPSLSAVLIYCFSSE